MMLALVWVAAIFYLRSPVGRQRADRGQLWRWVDAVNAQLGYPPVPYTGPAAGRRS